MFTEKQCNICNKTYASKQSLCNHIRIKHSNKDSDKLLKQPIFNENSIDIKLIEKEIQEIKLKCKKEEKEIEEIKLKAKELEISKNIGIIGNNNTIQQNTNNITINNFANDNLDCLDEDFVKRFFKHFLFDDEYHLIIPKIIERIKFNPDFKENNNVKITNLRSKIGYLFDNNKWNAIPQEELAEKMFNFGDQQIQDLMEQREKDGKLSENIKDNIDDFDGNFKEENKDKIKKDLLKRCYTFTKNEKHLN